MTKVMYVLKAIIVIALCVCIRTVCDVTGKAITDKIVDLTFDKEKGGVK